MMKKALYLGLDPSRFQYEGELTHFPIIEIFPRPFEGEVKEALHNLHSVTHFLFTSRTAVTLLCENVKKAGYSLQEIKEKIFISIGQGTSQVLYKCGFKTDHSPENETAEGVITLLETLDLSSAHLFFPRSSKGRLLIPEYLKKTKCLYTLVDMYDTHTTSSPFPDGRDFDEIIFTSASTVEAFFSQTTYVPRFEQCIARGAITQKALNHLYKKNA